MTEKENQNTDLTGALWNLALSALFRNMQNCEMKSKELYGLSLTIERIGTRLGKVSESISKVVKTEEKIYKLR